MNTARKFNDRHLRRYPNLVVIAVEYARHYDGDFEPMLEAQECLRRTGTLPVALARKALNILRQDYDPAMATLQHQAEEVLDADYAEYQAEVRRQGFKVVDHQPESPKPKERPHSITTKVKLHKPYVMVKSRQGAIHIATSGECRWELPGYYEARHLPEDRRHLRTPELWVYALCGNVYYGPIGRHIFLKEPEAPGRNQCVKCFPPDGCCQG